VHQEVLLLLEAKEVMEVLVVSVVMAHPLLVARILVLLVLLEVPLE